MARSPAPRTRVARIVSGGQTGVDRAALDVAIELGLPYGGWCPRGGWAEDMPTPPGLLARYPRLRETPSADPAERTRLNVRDSSVTLIVRGGVRSAGTDLTERHAQQLHRPYLVTEGEAPEDIEDVARWLGSLSPPIVLNVAGPRESEQPGVHALTRHLLRRLLQPGTSL